MGDDQKPRRVYWISGDKFVSMTTDRINEEYGWSKPKPRDWKMGFEGEKKKKRVEAMKRLGL